MKILKKVLCLLLSSMFLLFAGACDSKTYEDTTSNEFVSFKVTVDKTTSKGPEDFVKVEWEITFKKDFWILAKSYEIEDYLRVLAFNDKHDQEYYMSNFQHWDFGDVLNNTNPPIIDYDEFMSYTYVAPCVKGDTHYDKLLISDYYPIRECPKGKYRLYLVIPDLYLEYPKTLNGEWKEGVTSQDFLIPTDIVLNM